jgi:hypothetical protein
MMGDSTWGGGRTSRVAGRPLPSDAKLKPSTAQAGSSGDRSEGRQIIRGLGRTPANRSDITADQPWLRRLWTTKGAL